MIIIFLKRIHLRNYKRLFGFNHKYMCVCERETYTPDGKLSEKVSFQEDVSHETRSDETSPPSLHWRARLPVCCGDRQIQTSDVRVLMYGGVALDVRSLQAVAVLIMKNYVLLPFLTFALSVPYPTFKVNGNKTLIVSSGHKRSWKLAKIVIAACEWNKDHNCFSFHSLHLLGTVIDWWDPHFHQHAHTFSPFSLSSVVLCRALQQEVGRGGYQIAFTRDGVRDIERREGRKDKRRRGILSSDALTLPRLQSASFTSTGACSDANTWPWLSGRTCPSGSPYTSPGPSHAAPAPTPGSFVTSADRKLFGILYTGERWCSIFPAHY